MQSALPKRWRGLKTVETALLGGRGPHRVILAGLRPANMKDRASRAAATADLLLRICPALFRAGGMRRNNAESAIKSPPTIMRPWRWLTPRVRGLQGWSRKAKRAGRMFGARFICRQRRREHAQIWGKAFQYTPLKNCGTKRDMFDEGMGPHRSDLYRAHGRRLSDG